MDNPLTTTAPEFRPVPGRGRGQLGPVPVRAKVMAQDAAHTVNQSDGATRRIVWLLSAIILLSFLVGVMMFLPAEHRAEKLQQIEKKHQAEQALTVSTSGPGYA